MSSLLLTGDAQRNMAENGSKRNSCLRDHVWCCCLGCSPLLPRASHCHQSSAGSAYETVVDTQNRWLCLRFRRAQVETLYFKK